MRVDWQKNRVLAKIEAINEQWSERYAERIKQMAKTNLMGGAKSPTGHLASEIDVFKSRYKDGGHYVQAQGPGNWSPPYHASFVELGLSKTRKMTAIPFMRPALKQNRRIAIYDLEQHLI